MEPLKNSLPTLVPLLIWRRMFEKTKIYCYMGLHHYFNILNLLIEKHKISLWLSLLKESQCWAHKQIINLYAIILGAERYNTNNS